MKIISFNVNGIRAFYKKGGFKNVFDLNFDIVAIQETKAKEDQLIKEIKEKEGYFSYFDSAKERKGYSGVAVYTKIKPKKISYGLGHKECDSEGRSITLYFDDFIFINTYFPNGGRDEEHFRFKLRYYDKFLDYIKRLEKENKNIIFCGDFNVAHKEIDLARPKENENHIGFLPVERKFIDNLLENGFLDSFRFKFNEKIMYSWWDQKTRSRERNVGWRIDYIFVSKNLKKVLEDKKTETGIMTDFLGSDHAPTFLNIKI